MIEHRDCLDPTVIGDRILPRGIKQLRGVAFHTIYSLKTKEGLKTKVIDYETYFPEPGAIDVQVYYPGDQVGEGFRRSDGKLVTSIHSHDDSAHGEVPVINIPV